MAVLKINVFGGIAPRVPMRLLADDVAGTHNNLMVSAQEFRPLRTDAQVGMVPPGEMRTIYRMSRVSEGVFHTNVRDGWRVSPRLMSYVPGQLNDDGTERTVVTFDEGEESPRVVDVTGEDRVLGVPSPREPVLEHEPTQRFTREGAQVWFDSQLDHLVRRALEESIWADANSSSGTEQRVCRWYNEKPWAGAYEAYGFRQDEAQPWLMNMAVDLGRFSGAAVLSGYNETGTRRVVQVSGLPFWGHLPAPVQHPRRDLAQALQEIEYPHSGEAVFSEAQAAHVSAQMVAYLSTHNEQLAPLRAEMDRKVSELSLLLQRDWAAYAPAQAAANNPKPVVPSTPEWEHDKQNRTMVRAPEWQTYHAAMEAWRAAEEGRLHGNTHADHIASQGVAQVQALMAEIEALSAQVERLWYERLTRVSGVGRGDYEAQVLAEDRFEEERRPETRFYLTTFVTDWGEESAPGPVSEMVEADAGEAVLVKCPPPPPGRNITHWRVYRSNTGSQDTAFQFVDEALITTLEFTDKVRNEALGEVCPTIGWLPPPYRKDRDSVAEIKPPKGADPYLRGAVAMPNGIVAGFIDNFVAFCEPYHPYAWPVEYQITTETPIVGLGVMGQTLFVGTRASPYLISGADSMSMSAVKMDSDQACVSRRSIASVGGGVVYASPDGLCYATTGGVELITAAFFSREEWQNLGPSSIFAVAHDGAYYFWARGHCYILDIATRKLGTMTLPANAVFRDRITDHMYVVDSSGRILEAMGAGGRRTGVWHSRRYTLPKQTPFAWLRVFGEIHPGSPATIRWFADGALRHLVSVTSSEPVRLPAGRWLEHTIEVQSTARITEVMLAGSSEEIKAL